MNEITSHKLKLISLLNNCNNAAILDYGCGKGDFINLLLTCQNPPKAIVAADSDPAMIASITKRFSSQIKYGVVIPKNVSRPAELHEFNFDRIICHNVLECIDDKLAFINSFKPLLNNDAIFILSHHDFDTAIYNSSYKELSRNLVHHFADTKQAWQKYSDGQMGRKIPGLMAHSNFRDAVKCETWRVVDTEFKSGNYGFLMADMLMEVGKGTFSDADMNAWHQDLINKSNQGEYYFAIDLVVAITCK